MVRLLETDHLNDQLAALAWLRTQSFVSRDSIGVAGNSFGGIEAVLGAERGSYCTAVDSAGDAQSWEDAPEVQALMTRAVRNSRAPTFFFQAENDYVLSPSRTLSAAMKDAGKEFGDQESTLRMASPLKMGILLATSEVQSGVLTCFGFWTSIATNRLIEPDIGHP
jgi:acetyl esterase/lipase